MIVLVDIQNKERQYVDNEKSAVYIPERVIFMDDNANGMGKRAGDNIRVIGGTVRDNNRCE